MDSYFLLFGNCPELSLLESLAFFSQDKICLLKKNLALISSPTDLKLINSQIAGTVKILKLITQQNSQQLIENSLIDHLLTYPSNKKIILSLNNSFNHHPLDGLLIKKKLKGKLKIRLVFGQNFGVSSGYFLHHQIEEFFYIQDKEKFYLAKVISNQDVNNFVARDRQKPYAQREKGMLSPKLSLMMINASLALYNQQFKKASSSKKILTVLDPFCGSGTILFEALLRKFDVIGSDLDPKATLGCQKNLDWFNNRYQYQKKQQIFTLDALKLGDKLETNSIDLIITEPFLGKQNSNNNNNYDNIFLGLEKLYLGFFKEIRKILAKKNLITIVFPKVKTKNKIFSLERLLPKLEQLQFKQVNPPINYHHPRAIVEREIYFFSFQPMEILIPLKK